MILLMSLIETSCSYLVGVWCQIDVVSTSMRRNHVASTLIRRHFYIMCPLANMGENNVVRGNHFVNTDREKRTSREKSLYVYSFCCSHKYYTDFFKNIKAQKLQ